MKFARCPEQAQVAALGGQASSGSSEAHGAIMMAVCVGGQCGEWRGWVGVLAAASLPPGFPHWALGSYLSSHQSL